MERDLHLVFRAAAYALRAQLLSLGTVPVRRAEELLLSMVGTAERLRRFRVGIHAVLALYPELFVVKNGLVGPAWHDPIKVFKAPPVWGSSIYLPLMDGPELGSMPTAPPDIEPHEQPLGRIRTFPTEPHVLHPDMTDAHWLQRPMPLTPMSAPSTPNPHWTTTPTVPTWIQVAALHPASRGLPLGELF